MSKGLYQIPKHLLYLFSIYFLGILIFLFFRILLLLTEFSHIPNIPESTSLLLQAFIIGFRFDTVISCYILALPLIVLSLTSFFRWQPHWLYRIINMYCIILYTITFFACSADIPFFHQYFTRLNVAILQWTNTPDFMVKLVLQEFDYYKYFFLFLVIIIVFSYCIKKITKFFSYDVEKIPIVSKKYAVNVFLSIIVLVITLIGARGRVSQKSPIRVGTAFFSNYAFINQLGLNPAFTFIRSYLDNQKPENQSLTLMDNEKAIKNVQEYFNIPKTSQYQSPIARKIIPNGKSLDANIIIVIMESLSANKMTRYDNPHNLTPTLDSLSHNSYYFDNIYTAGIHTFNGIYSTLFSFPALLKHHPMHTTNIPYFTGIASTLEEHQYQTMYFTTHDGQFDNVEGFLKSNSYQQVISQKDYPSEKILSTLGVPDHYMFEFSIPYLNKFSENKKPFFAAYMTASDHTPHVIPDGISFTPHNKTLDLQITEYADWSIKHFLDIASQQEWFHNTIFVFVADHGAVIGKNFYDMPLSYHHTPLIIYSPLLSPKTFDCIGGQIDVFPTIMGLLNKEYVNNTMGIDLLKEKRPYIYFSADDKIGCLNKDFFYVWRENGEESLYKYNNGDVKNYFQDNSSLADSMKTYSFSMLQTTQWLITNKKTGKEKKISEK